MLFWFFVFWSRGVLWVFGCIDEIFEQHFFYPLQSSLDNFKWLKTLVEFLWYHNFSVSIYFDFDGFLVVLHVLLDIKKLCFARKTSCASQTKVYTPPSIHQSIVGLIFFKVNYFTDFVYFNHKNMRTLDNLI